MKCINIGPVAEKDRILTLQILKRIQDRATEESEEKNAFCTVLRQAKGGYSRKRFRHHKHA